MRRPSVVTCALSLLVVGGAAGLLGVVVACGSNGGTAAPCSTATSPCEAGSVLSNGQCVNVAGTLAGLRWELPCTDTESPICQTEVDGGDVQVVSTTLGGAPGQAYAVTLHFRGVVEMKTYAGGEAGAPQTAGAEGLANAQFFVSGGADNGDSANLYELQVSDPPSVYFLNSAVTYGGNVWWLDYSVTIPMKAGATITMTANAVDSREVANVNGVDGGPVLVPGVPPYPRGYDGQFIQMDVVSVVATP